MDKEFERMLRLRCLATIEATVFLITFLTCRGCSCSHLGEIYKVKHFLQSFPSNIAIFTFF